MLKYTPMVYRVEVGLDVESRRQAVAGWIQNSLKPAKTLLEHNELPTQDKEIIEEATAFEVRDYQLDAWGSVWDARQAGAKTGLVHLATGLGKTSVGVFDVIKFREEYREANGRDPKVLFACHKNEILGQAAERFKAFMPDASQGFYNGESKDRDGDITFATMQSLYADLRTFKPKSFDYIIYDEAHHAHADTFVKVVKRFKPVFQLALTATPDRMDELDIRDLFGDELFSKGLPEALADGWLAAPDYHIVLDDAVKDAMQAGFEGNSLKALAELFDVKPRNEVIAEDIKKEMSRIGLEFGEVKTIVFCQNIEHAEEMAKLLNGESYHSGIPAKQRKTIFDSFKNGKLQVITTRDMFNEGVDVPDARLLVFLRSTSSKTVFEQQLGRGLRKHAGKERVSVLDFVANVERIAMIQELAENVRSKQRGNEGVGSEGHDFNSETENKTGLSIHTANGDFDFDKIAIDLLEKYSELSIADQAPEGWVSLRSYSRSTRVSGVALNRIMDELGLETFIYRFGSRNGRAISPEQMKILDNHPETRIAILPEDYVMFTRAAELLEVTGKTLRDYLVKNNVELDVYKTKDGIRTLGVSPIQLADISEYFSNRGEKAEEGWFSINTASQELEVARSTLKKAIEELGLVTEMRRFGPTTAIALSAEQLEVLRTHPLIKVQRAPEGWLSLYQISQKYDVGIPKLRSIIDELNINTSVYKFGPVVTECLSTYDIDKLSQHSDITTQAPEGWLTIGGYKSKYGGTDKVIAAIIEELGIHLDDRYKFGPRRRAAMNPEQVAAVRAEYERRNKK